MESDARTHLEGAAEAVEATRARKRVGEEAEIPRA